MNQDAFDALAPEQQQALVTAGVQAAAPAGIEAQREDVLDLLKPRASPMDVLETSDANLDGILSALSPVYAELERNPRTAAHVDEIRELKLAVDAPPATLVCE